MRVSKKSKLNNKSSDENGENAIKKADVIERIDKLPRLKIDPSLDLKNAYYEETATKYGF